MTLKQVAALYSENPVTLQSWADKGWAKITPAPGPGRARILTEQDVVCLCVAIVLAHCGITPKLANKIADGCRDGLHKTSALKWSNKSNPYRVISTLDPEPEVNLLRESEIEQLPRSAGVFLDLTALICAVRELHPTAIG